MWAHTADLSVFLSLECAALFQDFQISHLVFRTFLRIVPLPTQKHRINNVMGCRESWVVFFVNNWATAPYRLNLYSHRCSVTFNWNAVISVLYVFLKIYVISAVCCNLYVHKSCKYFQACAACMLFSFCQTSRGYTTAGCWQSVFGLLYLSPFNKRKTDIIERNMLMLQGFTCRFSTTGCRTAPALLSPRLASPCRETVLSAWAWSTSREDTDWITIR